MSWKSITDTTEGDTYALAASELVTRLEGQLAAVEQFLADSEEAALTDPSLAEMRSKIEAAYQGAQETLDYIGQQDLDAVGDFYAVGALANVSGGLNLVINTNDPRDSITAVADFYRAVDVPNSDDALAIEDITEREAFIADRRAAWATGRVEESLNALETANAFAEASLEFRKAQIDPDYTPDPNRSFESIAGMNDEGRKVMTMSIYDDVKGLAHDPVDYEALLIYENMQSMRYTDIEENPGRLMDEEMQARVQQINMNVLARAVSGEYGETIKMQGFRDDKFDVSTMDPRMAMATFLNLSNVTFNPIDYTYGATSYQGIDPNYLLPNDEYVGQFLAEDFREEADQAPEQLARIRELVAESGGQLIPTERLYEAMGEDPAGPDYSKPPAQTMRRIESDIQRLEERISMLEELVADPEGRNFQDIMAERDVIGGTSVESLLLGLKSDIGKNSYGPGLDGETFQDMYDAGNFEQRLEAVMGVPMDQSKTMTFENSPLLQALNTNFQTFHPAENGAEVPTMRDGASQLGEALGARGGAVILDNHTQAEPVQFMLDSLPEIASRGSTKILIENTINLNTRTNGLGMIILNQNDPLQEFYESGDPEVLQGLKNGYALRLERIAETRDLTPEEQSQLDELHARDELERQLIEEAYTQYGIKFEFFGGGIEGRFADEFGMDARLLASNYGWDEQIRAAGEGVDNVIVWGGGAHFVDDLVGDRGDMVLDESLGYPTFSLANPGALLRDAGDYNLAPSESGRWVPNTDPMAAEAEASAPEVSPEPLDTDVAPATPLRP